MLMELGLVEQRLKAAHEVLDGAAVTDVAKRNGVTRQTVHTWLRRYASSGSTSKPETCPHQMTAVVEARIVEMRRTHPAWVRGQSAPTWPERVSHRCPGDPRSLWTWSVTDCSSPLLANDPSRTTSGGSGFWPDRPAASTRGHRGDGTNGQVAIPSGRPARAIRHDPPLPRRSVERARKPADRGRQQRVCRPGPGRRSP